MGQRLDRPAKAKKKNNKETAQFVKIKKGHNFSRSELELATSSELATETITKRMQVQRASIGNLEPEEIL